MAIIRKRETPRRLSDILGGNRCLGCYITMKP